MARTIARGKKRTSIALAALLTITSAGVAFAYWTSTGSGVGQATTGTSVAFTITTEDAVGTIAPGGAGQTVDFTVTNDGEGTQYLTAVTVAIGTGPTTPWVPTGTCDVLDYTASVTTAPAAGEIIAGGNVDGVITVTLANAAENQDDCQGQVVPLYLTAA